MKKVTRIWTTYTLNPDDTVTIMGADGIPRRINRNSCQVAIETVTRHKGWYDTEEAYNKALGVFEGAMDCFPKEDE